MSPHPQSLVLTEKAVKHHAKRLQKEMNHLGSPLTLSQSQQLFAKSLGFSNFHELQQMLRAQQSTLATPTNQPKQAEFIEQTLVRFFQEMEPRTRLIWLHPDGQIQYLPYGAPPEQDSFIRHQAFDAKHAQRQFDQIVNFLLHSPILLHYEHGPLDERLRNMAKDPDPHHHLLLTWKMPFTTQNHQVVRSVCIQLYPEPGTSQIKAIKFLLNYIDVEEARTIGRAYSKTYQNIAHLV